MSIKWLNDLILELAKEDKQQTQNVTWRLGERERNIMKKARKKIGKSQNKIIIGMIRALGKGLE